MEIEIQNEKKKQSMKNKWREFFWKTRGTWNHLRVRFWKKVGQVLRAKTKACLEMWTYVCLYQDLCACLFAMALGNHIENIFARNSRPFWRIDFSVSSLLLHAHRRTLRTHVCTFSWIIRAKFRFPRGKRIFVFIQQAPFWSVIKAS